MVQTVVRSYGGMLLFDFVAADVALVVEQPWLRVMDLLPPALYKQLAVFRGVMRHPPIRCSRSMRPPIGASRRAKRCILDRTNCL